MSASAGPGPLVGVIGGSGLYSMPELEEVEEAALETPFGSPSSPYVLGRLGGRRLAFLPRHGRGHRLMPSEIPFRANLYGFKALGAGWVISVSAVGSMREEIAPGEVVVPDQFFDRTRQRPSTFFGGGVVAHVGMADPVCPVLSERLAGAAERAGAKVHRGGTYLCIEGPQFSTRAESHVFRSWGVSVIGMTNLPEARLAREAELCYATLALVTDYDCWHEREEDVTVEAVVARLQQNVRLAQRIIAEAAPTLGPERPCGCGEALAGAILTDPAAIDPEARRRLDLLAGKYLSAEGPPA
ncbi:MAG: S-methyl-5'-thioadenosine phosphorylase [Nitrospinota bacterium]